MKIPADERSVTSHSCAHCGQPVNRPASGIRRAAARGHRLYCGRECANAGKATPLAERFEAKVDRSGGPDACHLWKGAIRAHGYGHIFTQEVNGRAVTELAHRVALLLDGQALPEWPMVVDHMCKNMACVNVRHLRVVTQAVNSTENSNAPHAINSRKTHCIRGHEFNAANTKRTANGHRACRACRQMLLAKYADAKRAA